MAEAAVVADLTARGYNVSIPVFGGMPYDLIAENSGGTLRRIQVKYASARQGDRVTIPLTRVHTNGSGAQTKPIDRRRIDGFAVYCPDTAAVYYVPLRDMAKCGACFTLRIGDPTAPIAFERKVLASGRVKWMKPKAWYKSRSADAYRSPVRMFSRVSKLVTPLDFTPENPPQVVETIGLS